MLALEYSWDFGRCAWHLDSRLLEAKVQAQENERHRDAKPHDKNANIVANGTALEDFFRIGATTV